MTFRELLTHLHERAQCTLLDGSVDDTLSKALAGRHVDPLAGEIVASLYQKPECTSPDTDITRAQAATALGVLRLRYMKDDAPVEGFRMVERVVHGIDGAFNEEALRRKGRPGSA